MLYFALVKFVFNGFKIPAARYDSNKNILYLTRGPKSYKKSITPHEMLLEIYKHPHIQILKISGQSLHVGDITDIANHLLRFPTIQSLNFDRNQLGLADDAALSALADVLSKCKSLTHLSFSSNKLSSNQSIFLASRLRENLPALDRLDLSDNLIDADGAAILAKLPLTMNLYANNIAPAMMPSLATEFHIPRLGTDAKENIISNPTKLYNFWRKSLETEVPFPSLLQLSIFKIKSDPACGEQNRLPVELRSELRRNIIF
jgi:hypothetical protein